MGLFGVQIILGIQESDGTDFKFTLAFDPI
jgi:hypothetical protein